MKDNQKMDLTKFEALSETTQGALVGGFSTAMAVSPGGGEIGETINDGCTNNCDGGNCIKGCGSS